MTLVRFALGLGLSLAFLKADTVEAILARMDQAAPSFKDLTADVSMDTYQKILDSHTVEKGTLQMQRGGKKKDVRAIIAFTGANDARTLAFLGKIVRIFYPNLNTYQDVNLGSSGAVVNQYLLLGFGSSGQELSQSYTVTAAGSEMVAGQSTTKLQLIPRDAKVAEKLAKGEIWIPDKGANPVQQEFDEASGNTRLVTYTNIQVNPPMRGILELKLPKGATKQSQ